MTKKEEIDRLRKEAEELLRHAEALQAYHDAKVKRDNA